jgi:hypothetical protein
MDGHVAAVVVIAALMSFTRRDVPMHQFCSGRWLGFR